MSKKRAGLEILEDPDALAGRLEQAEDLFETYQKPILGVVGVILLLIVGFFGYRYYQGTQDEAAQTEMFPSVFQLEADSLKKALNGDGANPGLVRVADDYGSTKAGKLANFYAGLGLLKQGKYDDAVEHLKNFSSSDLLVQARAYALIGDAYMEKKSYSDAADYYQKAADYNPNKYFTPSYLMKLAVAQENAKDNAKAVDAYSQIMEKYPESAEAPNAKKYKALLDAEAGE